MGLRFLRSTANFLTRLPRFISALATPVMLCIACQEIFAVPRKLSYGTYYDWKQDSLSFQAALQNGCHLCHLIEDSLLSSSTSQPTTAFPKNVRFAFKALSSEWAQFGTGPKWFPIPSRDFGPLSPNDLELYQRQLDNDPTPNNLGAHLASDSDTLKEEMSKSWLVLEFYGPDTHCVLPMDLATGDETEKLAQENMTKEFSTGCKGSLALARKWLTNCLAGHYSCCPDVTENWLPTRLVDVGSYDNQVIRLVSRCTLQGNPPYLALSHRWGSGEQTVLKLTNLRFHQQEIPWGDLSATLQQSVAVTRALGFRYLWVDTMCIIQDDPDDWSHEAGMMCKVYGLATCTIAGATSGGGVDGYFTDRVPYRARPCKVPNPFRINSKHSFYLRSQYLKNIHDKNVRGSSWYNRGWVFQERTLSPRLLIFSRTQILWACRELQAAEMWPEGKTSKNYIDTFPSLEIEKARFKRLLDPSNSLTRNALWFDFIRDYIASAKLTFESDKLIAVQGLATLVQNITDERYCEGLWISNDLPDALLWTTKKELRFIPAERNTPSWSWAALRGINPPDLRYSQDTEKLIKVIGHTTLSTSCKSKGSHLQALRVTGKLLPIVVSMPVSKPGNSLGDLLNHIRKKTTLKIAMDAIIVPLYIIPASMAILFIYWYANRSDTVGVIGSTICLCLILVALYYFGYKVYPKMFPRKIRLNVSQWSSTDSLLEFNPRAPLIGRLELKTDSNIGARFYCFVDYKIAITGDMKVFCLPLISREAKYTHGLILRPSEYQLGYYERLGTFSISKSRLEWSLESHQDESFWLV